MEATELIELIRTSEKKTPVRVVLQANAPCEFPGAEVFSGGNGLHILYGDWKTLGPQLTAQAAHIDRLHVENGVYTGLIAGENCRGVQQPLRLAEDLAARGDMVDYAASWAYGDSAGDAPMLALCAHKVGVNPKRKLVRRMKGADGFSVVYWSNEAQRRRANAQ